MMGRFYDLHRLTDTERAEVAELTERFEQRLDNVALTRLNLILGPLTKSEWMARIPRDRHPARVGGSAAPAPAPVQDDRRERERGSRRDRWQDEVDEYESVKRMARRGKW